MALTVSTVSPKFVKLACMQDASKIIQFLNQPGPTSGAQLGEAMGISRMAVQKRIQALVDMGLPVTASRGVGYVLDEGVTLLEAARIEQGLLPSVTSFVDSVDVFQSLESTNSYLLSKPFINAKAKVCLAESQSAGRGRRGNDWQSSPYRNVMLSLSWGFNHWPATITGLGLAVGLVVAEYLNLQYDAGVSIKWPNDLLVGERKLGGILVDVAGESSGACNVVIGLGLNVHQPDWSTETHYQWQDLSGLGLSLDRNRLAADLISVLSAMLSEFAKSGFSPLTERWNALSSYANKTVRVGRDDEFVFGQIQGVDETGALLLAVDGNIHRVDDSNLSVRLAGV